MELLYPMSTSTRRLVATASRILAAEGHGDLIWGHVSARDDSGRGVWLKSAEYGLEEVTHDLVHLVDWDGLVVEGGGVRHSEYPIHTEIMAARSDVNAVVHTHPAHAVALAATGQPLMPVSHAANMFVPPSVPRFTETADLILTPELGRAVADQLGVAEALFLVNHGIVVVGPDVPTAAVRAGILERACRQQLLTIGYGGWPAWSDPSESLAKREHIYAKRPMDAVWNYLVRTHSADPG